LKLTSAGMALVAVAIAMFVCVFLLTPLSGLETRPIPSIHPIGDFSLALVFLTAVLDAVALALLWRRPRTSALLAGLGIFLVIPGFILDQTGRFSSYAPPPAISSLEYVLLTIQALAFLVSVWLYRQVRRVEAEDAARTKGSSGSSPG
jgi:hypothetical protein